MSYPAQRLGWRPPSSHTPYRGVSYRRDQGIYFAQISVAGRQIHLGSYDTAQAAAYAYDCAAREYYGPEAVINGVPPPPDPQRRPRRSPGSSRYRGVFRHEKASGWSRWQAAITVAGRKKHLGCFTSEAEAARAYNEAVRQYGLSQPLNVIEEDGDEQSQSA